MYSPALRASAVFWLAGLLTACAGDTEQTATDPLDDQTAAPVVALDADASTVASGGSTTLSWQADNADECTANGGWSGARETSGSQSVGPLTADTQFSITCTGAGGSASTSVTVAVTTTEPSVVLTSDQNSVDSGEQALLTWSSEGVDGCTASGGWSGDKPANGSETTSPISVNTTYTLTCSGPLGNAVAMIEVSANGVLSISWQPPTENVDGSPLTDLSGYTIYYGTRSGDYTDQVRVQDASATDFSVTVASGDYFVAMTALDVDGNESALSNEVLKATL